MKSILVMLCMGILAIVFAGCAASSSAPIPADSATPSSTQATALPSTAASNPVPCVTATPPARSAQGGTAVVGSAQKTTPNANPSPRAPSLDELATREAELSNHNRPVTVPSGNTPNAPAVLPVCPTAPPTQ